MSIAKSMTRRRRIALLGIAGVGIAIWLAWPSRDPFDCAVPWTEPPPATEVSEIVADLLPTGYAPTWKALHGWGFTVGDFVVGKVYRRQPVPEPNAVNGSERVVLEHFNRMLDDNGAYAVTPLYKPFPGRGFCSVMVCVYLLHRQAGEPVLRAFIDCPMPRP